ncbi:MAG: hypothetical protein ACK4UN_15525 [Limisphaerales bacterium]
MRNSQQQKHLKRVAAWVITNLPDSVTERGELLADLAYSFPVNSEDAQKVLELRSHLMAHENLQKQLPLDFSK